MSSDQLEEYSQGLAEKAAARHRETATYILGLLARRNRGAWRAFIEALTPEERVRLIDEVAWVILFGGKPPNWVEERECEPRPNGGSSYATSASGAMFPQVRLKPGTGFVEGGAERSMDETAQRYEQYNRRYTDGKARPWETLDEAEREEWRRATESMERFDDVWRTAGRMLSDLGVFSPDRQDKLTTMIRAREASTTHDERTCVNCNSAAVKK
jgi:hypothetical protein